jgi:hypothetical protein
LLRNFAYLTEFSSRHSDSAFFEGCISTYPLAYGSTVVEGRVSPDGLATTTVTGPFTMWAQPFWVEYQETDLSLFPITTTSSIRRPTSSPSQPSIMKVLPSSSAAASSPTPTVISKDGLSIGATAGIGIAAALIAFIVLASVLFLCLRKRRISKSRRSPKKNEQGPAWEKSELDACEPWRELEGSRNYPTREIIARNPVSQEVVELE